MDKQKIFQICPICKGTGIEKRWEGNQEGHGTIQEIVCTECGGEKKIYWGYLKTESES